MSKDLIALLSSSSFVVRTLQINGDFKKVHRGNIFAQQSGRPSYLKLNLLTQPTPYLLLLLCHLWNTYYILICLINMQSYYCDYRINKPFACSRCVHFLLSVHCILTYYVRKGSWAFYLNYPQTNEVGQSDHVVAPL